MDKKQKVEKILEELWKYWYPALWIKELVKWESIDELQIDKIIQILKSNLKEIKDKEWVKSIEKSISKLEQLKIEEAKQREIENKWLDNMLEDTFN